MKWRVYYSVYSDGFGCTESSKIFSAKTEDLALERFWEHMVAGEDEEEQRKRITVSHVRVAMVGE